MSKVSSFSNTCASLVGGVALYFTKNIEDIAIQQGIISLIPALTLMLAYFFKLVSNYGFLSGFNLLLKVSAEKELNDLRDALNDDYISADKKLEYQKMYEKALDEKINARTQNTKNYSKMTKKARNTLETNLDTDYRDNKDLEIPQTDQ